MIESHPSYYWVMGRFIHPIRFLRDDLPKSMQIEFVTSALHGLEMFLREQSNRELLPRSTEKAITFHAQLLKWTEALVGARSPIELGNIASLHTFWDSFSISFQDELDRLPMYTVMPKGNLDIHSLVSGASGGYPKSVRELLDKFVTEEIDHAGKCLAFELPTSCGFHILRAVETGMKGYVHAATGQLPPMRNRNWGEYIQRLTDAGTHSDVIDILLVLKTKRNPLMHPTDALEIEEAISLMCICQAGIEALVADVRRRSLESKFKESLRLMPDL